MAHISHNCTIRLIVAPNFGKTKNKETGYRQKEQASGRRGELFFSALGASNAISHANLSLSIPFPHCDVACLHCVYILVGAAVCRRKVFPVAQSLKQIGANAIIMLTSDQTNVAILTFVLIILFYY